MGNIHIFASFFFSIFLPPSFSLTPAAPILRNFQFEFKAREKESCWRDSLQKKKIIIKEDGELILFFPSQLELPMNERRARRERERERVLPKKKKWYKNSIWERKRSGEVN